MQSIIFKEFVKKNIVLMDGAMGTYFRYLHPQAGEAEFANVEYPEWIQEIHEEYIQAGARVIRTNTFAVNHRMFERNRLETVVRAAVENAKAAIEHTGHLLATNENVQNMPEQVVYIAGSIGPIRMEQETEYIEVLAEYQDICDWMYVEGVRIFVLETFSDVSLATNIAKYLKEKYSSVFVQVQYSINRAGYTLLGQNIEKIVRDTEDCSAIDGIGFNCGIGVAHMTTILSKLTFSRELVFSALPNAGYEQGLQGRHFLLDNPSYYAQTMKQLFGKGVNLIGGCCGTTPAHIKALDNILKDNSQVVPKKLVPITSNLETLPQDNDFLAKLNRNEKVYVVEIDSPFNGNADRFLASAKDLKENDVDLVTISDSPMGRARAEAFAMGGFIKNQTDVRVMPHICCRDRNLIGLRSSMLGAHINGIRDILIITGDPVGLDDRSTVTGVFDVNSIRLMEYVKHMNEELFANDPFYYGGALNYAGVNIDAIAARMKKKMEAGCSYFLTQPVYSDSDIERIAKLKKMTDAKIIVGLMPIVSYKNAMFMKNEMPGIDVPDEIVDCYQADMSREEAEQVAVRICVDIGKKSNKIADGYYLMTPFNRVGLVNEIVNCLRKCDKSN